jgi:DnaJ-class molecular chaperone
MSERIVTAKVVDCPECHGKGWYYYTKTCLFVFDARYLHYCQRCNRTGKILVET